jgi:membrane-associated protease RseP (regulator of RpoE activity)
MTILIALLALGWVIFIHELGHYLVARAAGVTVSMFSIGFGPRLLSFTRWGTQFQLSLIPLGGYVSLGSPERMIRDYPAYVQIAVYLAGIAMNVAYAVLVLIVVNSQYVPSSIAAEDAVRTLGTLVRLSVDHLPAALWNLLTFQKNSGMGGPVAIVSALSNAAGDLETFVLMTALISFAVGISNLFPLPVLDGWHALRAAVEAIVRRKLPAKLEAALNATSMLFLFMLLAVLTVSDIRPLL